MTLAQMRLMQGLITDAITKLAQGGEEMDRLTEAFVARGGTGAIGELRADNPDQADEIDQFAALVADVTPIVEILQSGLMAHNSAARAILMERRGDV